MSRLKKHIKRKATKKAKKPMDDKFKKGLMMKMKAFFKKINIKKMTMGK